MFKQHVVTLSPEERADLRRLIAAGTSPARRLTRARILLKADAAGEGPRWIDAEIAAALEVSARTVARVRSEWASGGVARVLAPPRSRRVYAAKLDDAACLRLTQIACSPVPEGQSHWTLRLLGDRLVELEIVDSIARETVRLALKKTGSNPGLSSVGV
jgi:Homeodomain-like domain